MMFWLVLGLVILMLGAAVAALVLQNLVAAVAASSVVSLALSALFVVLQAPDVALTEAAVGAGVSGLVLALALRRVGAHRLDHAADASADHAGDDHA